MGRAIKELPAGMLDEDAGDFSGAAAKEVRLRMDLTEGLSLPTCCLVKWVNGCRLDSVSIHLMCAGDVDETRVRCARFNPG